MFRRFYAILFMYRFEDATLQALSQQLCHLHLEMTRQYVVDTVQTPREDRIPSEFRVRLLSRERHTNEIEAEIKAVAEEKLQETILAILQGKNCSGGFEKLVRRIHNKLASSIEYRNIQPEQQALKVSQRMIARGHEVRPFQHGECMAGSISSRGLGHCRSEEGQIDQTRARPALCKNCPYHHVSAGYVASLKNLVADLQREADELPPGTLLHKQLVHDKEQAEAVVAFHLKRMGQAK